MAINVPMPDLPGNSLLKGIDTGSSMFTRLMNPILQREQQKQLDEHFKKEFGLKQAASGRAAALQPLHQQMLEQQLLGLKHKNDPMYEINQWKALQDMIMGGGQPGGQAMPQEAMPSQEMGEGMGMFSPEGLGQAQQPQTPQVMQGGQMGGVNLEALRQNPMLRGFFKHKFGVDPLAPMAQTPEDKQAAALELFKQKEQIKAANKTGSGETLTAPIKTKYQNVIGGVRSAIPIIDKLIEETRKGNVPGQLVGSLFKRDAQSTYKAEISTLLDGIRNAYTITNTDSGTKKAEDKVLRNAGESDANYIKRLQLIRKQMIDRDKDARTKLSAGNITAGAPDTSGSNEFSSMSDEELRKIAGGG